MELGGSWTVEGIWLGEGDVGAVIGGLGGGGEDLILGSMVALLEKAIGRSLLSRNTAEQ